MPESPPQPSPPPQPESTPPPPSPALQQLNQQYWRANLAIMAVLLTIWAIVGLGCGILFADFLNQYRLGGYPLGFWFAQQGSIMTFVLIILTYCILLNRLDNKHHKQREKLEQSGGAA